MAQQSTHKGLILKQAREAKGIPLQMVHEATKIPLDALKAIEEGYKIRTLSDFYYKGFLKIYARYLGVNINEVLDDYHPEKLPEPIRASAQPKEENLAPNPLALFLTPKNARLMAKVVAGVVIVFIAVKIVGAVAQKFSSGKGKSQKTAQHDIKSKKKSAPTSAANRVAKADSEKPSQAEKSKVVESSSVSVSSKSPVSIQAKSEKINFTVRAKKDSWLQVRLDGDVVFQSILKKGAAESWEAREKIELSGKDISQLELELNGKIIGPVSQSNRQAKKVIITHSGFLVQ